MSSEKRVVVSTHGEVFIVHMKDGENRFNEDFMRDFNEALDIVESSSGPAAVIITGEDKFFSNGLDLAWLGENISKSAQFFKSFHHLLNRILTMPILTVAAMNGHAYAGGAMLALACDFRFMRTDRGFFCLPEIDINAPLTPGMTALIAAKISQPTLRDSILLGRKYNAEELLSLRLADAAYHSKELLSKAIAFAETIASKAVNRSTLGALKKEMYSHSSRLLEESSLGSVALPKL
eukprot:TRINITY_DN4250_c0_g1_i1.p1 TRINITY_DN4250_c0_g1~~TRINITY_DN4250_c0_g1_i1.p1  ORF type:complete len:236 (-),score=64.13 TRINITY_DN4250_c0_g1_i1:185-892(-)